MRKPIYAGVLLMVCALGVLSFSLVSLGSEPAPAPAPPISGRPWPILSTIESRSVPATAASTNNVVPAVPLLAEGTKLIIAGTVLIGLAGALRRIP